MINPKVSSMTEPKDIDQDAILSTFLYHLEGALAIESPNKNDTERTTAFMQADDEDDVKFIESLLTLKYGGDSVDKIGLTSDRGHCLDDSSNTFDSYRHCRTTFLANFHINAVQNNKRSDGRIDAIAVTIPAMTSNGLMYCMTSSRGYSQQVAEANASVRVCDNVEADDWNSISAELYEDPGAKECDDVMDESWQQQEALSPSSVSSLSSSIEHDIIASLPAYLGGRITSRNATSRIRRTTSLPSRSWLNSCSIAQMTRSMVNDDEIDVDMGLFSDSYGELYVDGIPIALPGDTAADGQSGSPPLTGTRRIIECNKYDTFLTSRKQGKKIVSRNGRRNIGLIDRYSLRHMFSREGNSKFRQYNRIHSRLLNALKRRIK